MRDLLARTERAPGAPEAALARLRGAWSVPFGARSLIDTAMGRTEANDRLRSSPKPVLIRRVWLGVALCLLLATSARAGIIADQLIPIAPDLSDLGAVRTYAAAVQQRLLGQRPGPGPYVIVLPTFEREWALQVGIDRGEPFVFVAEAETSVWREMHVYSAQHNVSESESLDALRVPIARASAPLPRETGQAVIAAWGVHVGVRASAARTTGRSGWNHLSVLWPVFVF